MPKPPRPSLAAIVAGVKPERLRAADAPASLSDDSAGRRATLKERAKQLSVYLEPPVYDQLRDLAYTERAKIHGLMLEAVDLLFKARGASSIRQLIDGR